ncbi:MAG: hypothetical protein P8M30_13680 [Planctomycetaceae bacterium]|nr:hypothetical protein [Planctomycetaceae bacterium]MDG2390356.1 hypothetical protein [Planctomycetaceae bacterium]
MDSHSDHDDQFLPATVLGIETMERTTSQTVSFLTVPAAEVTDRA